MTSRIKKVLRYSAVGLGSLLGISLYMNSLLPEQPLSQGSMTASRLRMDFAQLPLVFEPNVGQSAGQADFLARGPGYTLYLSRDAATFRAYDSTAGSSFRLRLVDAGASGKAIGQEKLASHSHYLIGNDSTRWRRNVANYGEVVYRDVYPGTDLVYYGSQGRMEFDFRLAPDASPQQIRLAFDGVTERRLNAAGDLVLRTGGGDLRLEKPVAYQEIGGSKQKVAAAFDLAQADIVRFRLGSYDTSLPLIIDPVVTYSSYLGGGGDDDGRAVAVDGDGNRYITGSTNSIDFPSAGNNAVAGLDVFVAKLRADGTGLDYATYIGGAGDDVAYDIAVDADDNVYLTGDTNSVVGFPLVNEIQNRLGGDDRPNNVVDTDAFVIKLAADGETLLYSTYLGGYGVETSRTITLDSARNMYVGGSSTADDFPVQNALQPASAATAGQGNGFITKISADGSALVYSTYFGGAGPDKVNAIVVDASGEAYLTGDTSSATIASVPSNVRANGYQPQYGGNAADAFIAKLAGNGASFIYFTYLGGGSWDRGLDLAVDDNGSAYVTGFTSSARVTTGTGVLQGFPLTDNAIQRNNAGGVFDAFLTKLNAAGDALVYSTYIGGSGEDEAYAVTLDSQKRAMIVGRTLSDDFPLENAVQHELLGDSDGFVVQLNPSGSNFDFSSYLGGTGDDSANNVTNEVVDTSDIAHIVGTSSSQNFPTVVPLQSATGGGDDVFVVAVDTRAAGPDLSVVIADNLGPVPKGGELTYDVIVSNAGPVDATGILIKDTAENATVVAASSTQGSCRISNGEATCDLGDIANGSSATIEVTVSVLKIGTASNTATLIRANESDADAANNSAMMESIVVDRSGESGSISYIFLILIIMGLFVRRATQSRM